MTNKNIVVVGAGFAGLSAATYLAKKGFSVKLFDKNTQAGGRARSFVASGFTFDMGPSWYWMPDVFQQYFTDFSKDIADYLDLIRLDPSYAVIFKDDAWKIPAGAIPLGDFLETFEEGSKVRLQEFLEQAQYKYKVGMHELVYKPGLSISEYLSFKILLDVARIDVLQSFHKHIRKFFKHPKILQLMEFPVLFLGATPQNTPALYSLMNYADISLGTWYPQGGMHKIVEAMAKVAVENGVELHLNEEVKQVTFSANAVNKVITTKGSYDCDAIVAAGDYHYFEQSILPATHRTYTEAYWDSRTMAPSSLLFYLGVRKKVDKLEHHNLFFDADFSLHAEEIYERAQWPTEPLFYVCAPSKTDPSVAPEGMENLFVLIPVAPDLEDTDTLRSKYFDIVMKRLEKYCGTEIREYITYKKSYAHSNFVEDYYAFKGNAYGLANTLKQTAILKPSLRSKKVKNLFYAGQLTVPGPGVPPSLISGKVVAEELNKFLNLS